MAKHTSTAESLLQTKTQETTTKNTGGRKPYYPLCKLTVVWKRWLHKIFFILF